MSRQEGHAHWSSVFADIDGCRLTAPSLVRTLPRLLVLLGLIGVALWQAWLPYSDASLVAAYAALALLLAQCAFIGHDAGHGTVSRSERIGRAIGQVSMTIVTGLAFDEWIARHRAHHRYCQEEARDPDLLVSLVVSLTDGSLRAKGPVGRFISRYQAIHIWLLSLLFGHSQRHLSQAAVLGNLRRYRLDALMLVLHAGLWFGIPCLLLEVPLRLALLAYVVPLTILGPYLAAIFWVNHIGMPLIGQADQFSFFEHQSVTSRTILNPPALNWLFGGLNFQIEHHLFPQVPSARLAAVQPIVRQHFARHGIPYNGVSWRGAIVAIGVHLRRIAGT